MCVPDQKRVHPECHHEWYDWVLCAHHGTDDLGHPTPCLAAADATAAPAPAAAPTFCPVCFVGFARSGWTCSICSNTNYTGALWQQVECAHCGDFASLRAGHVTCRLCVAVVPGQPTNIPEPEILWGGADADLAWEGDDEMEDDNDLDFDLDVDEELEPIDDIDALYDGMAGVFTQTLALRPALRPEETTDEEERGDFMVIWRRRPGDESDDTMSDSE
ncbi:hypothetical protein QBC37DRAFT_379261 [Rhypophila decipiens]|uniref:Uncharacterized protein n=1 Tax=Rhypophila decipiens TaxID=261697 RepID=A0AAN6XYY2_9PEZI|nr:hypothetical protein QBC37DRAFT_379261 [Rhypophila decipiens]